MDRAVEKKYSTRAVELGNSGDPTALAELLQLLTIPSVEVSRLTISAIGKLAGLVDPTTAVTAIAPFLRHPHPQVRQYTIKALLAYGTHSRQYLADLCNISENPNEKEYNRDNADRAIGIIREALYIEEKQALRRCQRCSMEMTAEEFARSQRAFQRDYCDHCFDEVYISRRNWDIKIELNKNIKAKDGTLVQSRGEKYIADWLSHYKTAYRYDERIRIIEGYAVRPDFYLPEFDLYIEYWGMDTIDYKIGMLKKKKVYQLTGKKLISIYPGSNCDMHQQLWGKLSKYISI
jgi:hypothetical protein